MYSQISLNHHYFSHTEKKQQSVAASRNDACKRHWVFPKAIHQAPFHWHGQAPQPKSPQNTHTYTHTQIHTHKLTILQAHNCSCARTWDATRRTPARYAEHVTLQRTLYRAGTRDIGMYFMRIPIPESDYGAIRASVRGIRKPVLATMQRPGIWLIQPIYDWVFLYLEHDSATCARLVCICRVPMRSVAAVVWATHCPLAYAASIERLDIASKNLQPRSTAIMRLGHAANCNFSGPVYCFCLPHTYSSYSK